MNAPERKRFVDEWSVVPARSRRDIVAFMQSVSRYFEGPPLVRALTNVHLEICCRTDFPVQHRQTAFLDPLLATIRRFSLKPVRFVTQDRSLR
jgi:hypothetical protein